MKLQSKMPLPLMVAFLVLVIPMMAGAAPIGTFTSELNPTAPGQTFYGDGAVYGSGYLQAPPVNLSGDKCLQCHQGVPADFNPNVIIPDKRSYLRTGHGNMLKKVTSPPQVWNGADGLPHSTTSEGHVIDWTTGTVDLGGFCDVGGFSGQFLKSTCEATTACTLDASNHPASYTTLSACVAAGGQWKMGTWTPAWRPANIIYFVGDWMTGDAPDTGITGAGLPANKFLMADGRQYGTCGSCHNSGYRANDYTRPQPFTDYPNFPRSSAAGVGGSWVLDGIQCERCHDATKHYAPPYIATVPTGASSTALCSQCHIRPAAYEGSANPNASTQPTAYPIGASATNFGGHLIGKQFLNSPHGKFTGSYGQIATTIGGLYNSRFSDGTCSVAGEFLNKASCDAAGGIWTSFQGGCATCHDVHQSTVPEARANFGAHPFKRECTACHSEKSDLSTLRHPRGHGTPQEEGQHDIGAACASCHMPKPAGGTGLSVHVFRINTDPTYSTFPAVGATTPGYCSDPSYTTRTACIAAGKSWSLVANSAPDGTWTNAVWVDLDLACGKCHGSGGEAKPLSKKQLARYAKGIHGVSQRPNTPPTAAMTALPTVTGYTVSFQDNSTDVEDPQSALRIAVDWGDWTIETGLAGGTFSHTYISGGAFTIRHTATDTRGLKGYESISVVISGKR